MCTQFRKLLEKFRNGTSTLKLSFALKYTLVNTLIPMLNMSTFCLQLIGSHLWFVDLLKMFTNLMPNIARYLNYMALIARQINHKSHLIQFDLNFLFTWEYNHQPKFEALFLRRFENIAPLVVWDNIFITDSSSANYNCLKWTIFETSKA